MDEYAGRLLAERYRLPLPPAEEYELRESRAYDTASGQEVLVHQVPLPEVVDAELIGEPAPGRAAFGRATRAPEDPAIRRAVEAATAASRIPDHPRLDQVFDVFVEDDGLWIVSELVAARPLAAVLAEHPLTPHRAAEIAADLLAALSAVHTHGWTHRNITARTVLICEDGRALLTGLASGAAEEALSGYDPLPTDGPMAPSVFGGEIAGGQEGVSADVPPAGGRADPVGSTEGEADAERTPPSARVPEAHGPWGGDKPGPPMAIPLELGYQPRRSADTSSTEDESPRPARSAESYETDDAHEADDVHEPYETYAPYEGEEVSYGTYGTEAGAVGLSDEADGESRGAWGGEPLGEEGTYRGPTTSLAAERARQARMTMVGAVTERWAPEQAGPVYGNWRLAPPVGPAADLWALGCLLFRAVQGHAPYPEESAAELVQLVCAEPPAYAEECGALRPVIESLLRQDPTERPSYEELSGWLRSLIRSAPEPDAGRRVIGAQLPPGRPSDPRRLPIIRRRGELVRRRRAARQPGAAGSRRPRQRTAPARRAPAGDPRRLGRMLIVGVFLMLAAGIAVAVWLMPKADSDNPNQRGSVNGAPSGEAEEPTEEASEDQRPGPSKEPGSSSPQSTGTPSAPEGYRLQDDPAGFRIAVPQGWARGQTSEGQVRFRKGGMELLVVPGRDKTAKYGTDPGDYQLSEQPELAEYRQSTGWKTSSGVRTITVGETAMAEGEFGWESGGAQTVVRNRVILLGDAYHVIMVKGPQSRQKEIDERFTTVVDTYRAGS